MATHGEKRWPLAGSLPVAAFSTRTRGSYWPKRRPQLWSAVNPGSDMNALL
jgi:hypothetical protein